MPRRVSNMEIGKVSKPSIGNAGEFYLAAFSYPGRQGISEYMTSQFANSIGHCPVVKSLTKATPFGVSTLCAGSIPAKGSDSAE